jgi:hypothetical protein
MVDGKCLASGRKVTDILLTIYYYLLTTNIQNWESRARIPGFQEKIDGDEIPLRWQPRPLDGHFFRKQLKIKWELIRFAHGIKNGS